jgi:hypothetical protein
VCRMESKINILKDLDSKKQQDINNVMKAVQQSVHQLYKYTTDSIENNPSLAQCIFDQYSSSDVYVDDVENEIVDNANNQSTQDVNMDVSNDDITVSRIHENVTPTQPNTKVYIDSSTKADLSEVKATMNYITDPEGNFMETCGDNLIENTYAPCTQIGTMTSAPSINLAKVVENDSGKDNEHVVDEKNTSCSPVKNITARQSSDIGESLVFENAQRESIMFGMSNDGSSSRDEYYVEDDSSLQNDDPPSKRHRYDGNTSDTNASDLE